MLKKFLFIILLLIGAKGVQANCTTGLPPAAPVIISVSVDANGDIVICWDPVLDPDLAGYNIWTVDNTGANLLLTTPSLPVGANCYTYPAATNSSGSQCVQILVEAFDNCPLPGPFSSGIFAGGFVKTMHLEARLDPCTSSIELKWNENTVFTNPIYEVFAYINGGAALSQGTTFDTTFSYLGVMEGDSVNFYILAVDNGGLGPATSTSNIDTPNVDGVLIKPTFNYLNYVTVVDSQQVDLQFTIDTIADMTSYEIQRSTSINGPFVTVGIVDKFLGMDTIVNFSDIRVNTDSNSYFYRINIVNDTCGFDNNYSNLASTILVGVTSNPMEAFNTVTFTEYIDWDLGVSKYDLYRAVGGVWELSPIRSFLPFSDSTTYVDDISEVFEGNGEFCYKVIAIGNALEESSSNEACALHNSRIFVPSAFAPTGLFNKEFKPILTFANPNAYTFRVFNRLGRVVFETGDVSEAWNGRFNNFGDISPISVYFYVVEFESAEGDSFIKRGTVTLVN